MMETVKLPASQEPVFITPYLPAQAKMDIESAKAKGMKIFQRVVPITSNVECRNCADIGFVYVSHCKAGPFKTPPNGLSTWYDGGPYAGKGWYVIKDTFSYPCPECQS